MTAYVALLRAVGGTGKLAMSGLRAMCEDAGFDQVRAYVASGNAILLDGPPPVDVPEGIAGRNGEEIRGSS